MKNIEIILTIATTAVGLLITTITFIQKFLASEKAKKNAEHFSQIGKAILTFIADAETLINLTGQEKKQFVMEKVDEFATTNKMNYDVKAVCCHIEECLKMSKKVNVKND